MWRIGVVDNGLRAFVHLGATAAGLPRPAGTLDTGTLPTIDPVHATAANARSIPRFGERSQEAVVRVLPANHEAAAHVEGLDEAAE